MREPVEIEERHPFRQADVLVRYHDQDGVCALCPASIAERFIKDHRVPRAMGGKTNLANLQLICLDCAATKDPADISAVAKAKRQGAGPKVSRRPMPKRPFQKNLRRHLDGTTSER
jgi:5-methylcytosine-specific restriction endonuclease McrA